MDQPSGHPGTSPNVTVRVGTDLQEIDEVADGVRQSRQRYLTRLFTPHEVSSCGGPDAPEEVLAPGLAARFAAKEAVLKLLRPAATIPAWTEIEVVSHETGWTSLRLTGSALSLAEEAGLDELSVSFAHGRGVAVATVVGICRPG